MKINSTEYLNWLSSLSSTTTTQTTQTTTSTTENSSVDAYIPSNSEDDILYANYNDIMSTMAPPPMPPVSETNTDSGVESETNSDSTAAVSDAVKSILDNLSESLRANADTVISTLQSLGLTPEDLLDSDNVELVANTLSEQAEALGLPAVDDLDDVIASLKSSVENTVSSLEEEYSLTEEDLEELIEELKKRLAESIQVNNSSASAVQTDDSQIDETTYSTLLNALQTEA